MLGWEQVSAGTQLHAYDGHDPLPVCKLEAARRSYDDKQPRTLYRGEMPPRADMICKTCQTWERDHDPMFVAGREHERKVIARTLGQEANRIYNKQAQDYPSNTLDTVSLNLLSGETEELSRRR
jgi:hypothetical protein